MIGGLWLAADFFGSVAGVFFWSTFADLILNSVIFRPKVADFWYK